MPRTIVKICGITNIEDARLAVEAGADAIGFNFWPRSRRYIEPKAAKSIVSDLPRDVLTVGVLVNEESPAAAEQIAEQSSVNALQLHGDETPEFCSALRHRWIIKALGVDDSFDPSIAIGYDVQAIMLDAADRTARGGTGRTIDWSIAQRTAEIVQKLFLAGGLSPENVSQAISIVRPFAVDACSSLELTPGKKDPERLVAFIRAALES